MTEDALALAIPQFRVGVCRMDYLPVTDPQIYRMLSILLDVLAAAAVISRIGVDVSLLEHFGSVGHTPR